MRIDTSAQEANKDEYLAYMSEKVSQLSTFLGDRPWFAGERVSSAKD